MNDVTLNFGACDLNDCCQRGCMTDSLRVGVSGFRSRLRQRFVLSLSTHVKNALCLLFRPTNAKHVY